MPIACSACETEKDATEFYPSMLARGTAAHCKACIRIQDRARRLARGIVPRPVVVKPERKPRRVLAKTETHRECGKCATMRGVDEFYPSVLKTGRGAWCKDCTRLYYRDLHASRPGLHAEIQRKQRRRKRDFVRSFKKECQQCGEDHPAVLDLHHLDPAVKEFNVSWAAANNRSLDKLEAEIAKCVVLCANCHRKLHWEESQQTASERPSLVA